MTTKKIVIILVLTIMALSCKQRQPKTVGAPLAGAHSETPLAVTHSETPQESPTAPLLDIQALHEALIQAIQTDDQPTFDRLISQVPDIDVMIPFEDEYVEYSLLGFASKFKRCAMAEKIINHYADITIGQGDEYNIHDALYVAVESKDLCIVQLLLNKGANPNRMQTESGLTVLSMSCRDGGNYDIAKLLIENGAEVNGLGDTGFDFIIYPLLEAVESNNIALVQLLIDNNCTVDICDTEGRTPFSVAAQNNNPQMLELLQKHTSPNDE